MFANERRSGKRRSAAPAEHTSGRPRSSHSFARAIFAETVSIASITKSTSPCASRKAGRFSVRTNSSTVSTWASGLIARTISRATSVLRRPMVLSQATAWRFTFEGCTTSQSTSTNDPMPPRARASRQFEPTPPKPKSSTFLPASRSTPSWPNTMDSRPQRPSKGDVRATSGRPSEPRVVFGSAVLAMGLFLPVGFGELGGAGAWLALEIAPWIGARDVLWSSRASLWSTERVVRARSFPSSARKLLLGKFTPQILVMWGVTTEGMSL